jgi:hypothetical protein
VAVRVCPHCKTEIPAYDVAAYSFGFECPKCETRLEVSPGTRELSSVLGLAAGAIAWRLSIHPGNSGGDLGSVLPTLYAFLAFGIVSPVVLLLTASVRNAPAIPVHEPAHGHGGSAHDSAGHAGGHGGNH